MARIWDGCQVPLHIGLPGDAAAALQEAVATMQVALQATGAVTVLEPGFSPPVPDLPAGDRLDCGLLALALPRALKKDHPLLPWLSTVKAPLLLILI